MHVRYKNDQVEKIFVLGYLRLMNLMYFEERENAPSYHVWFRNDSAPGTNNQAYWCGTFLPMVHSKFKNLINNFMQKSSALIAISERFWWQYIFDFDKWDTWCSYLQWKLKPNLQDGYFFVSFLHLELFDFVLSKVLGHTWIFCFAQVSYIAHAR